MTHSDVRVQRVLCALPRGSAALRTEVFSCEVVPRSSVAGTRRHAAKGRELLRSCVSFPLVTTSTGNRRRLVESSELGG